MEDRPGASLLDISLFFGIPALLIILAIGMASRLQLMVDLDHSRAQILFHTGIFTSIVVAVTRILLMTQQIRRLRDVNRSGWWCLLFLIPYLGPIFFLLLILKGGDEESNEYGLPPPPNTLGVHLGVVLFVAIAIFALASSEATSLRLPARFFLGLTTMFRPEAPKVPEVPQAMPQQSAPPVFQPGAGNAPDPSSSGPQKKSPLDDLNDFTRYSNKKLHLRQAFQQAGNALRTAEGNAQALEQWSSSEDALVNALQFQVAQARESIEVRKRDRATPVSSSLPRFADIFDQGIGRTQDIMERLEGLYADLLARAQRTGIDKAFQKELDRFKYALNTLKLDHGIMYAETRREMCAYTRNPDDWLREYQSSRGLQTEKENMEAEWCD
ncbi:MAG: DUF805 domain-containing protein [Candidatus Accumulibacter sp.]|nr:DUF805 domain-containing protein [Accumulibacter sp.]